MYGKLRTCAYWHHYSWCKINEDKNITKREAVCDRERKRERESCVLNLVYVYVLLITLIVKIIHLNFRISIYSKRQFLYFIYQYGFPISLN
jgi:hypothetical protein